VLPLLDEPRLIHDEHRVTLAQLFDYIAAQHVACGVGIPLRPFQQVLHAVGCRFADPFGELPAVLALDCAQQALQVRERPLSGLGPPEQISEPLVQCLQFTLPRLCS
jgi:hypothetical protein